MKIYNVTDKEYQVYGRVLTSDYKVTNILKAMESTPAPGNVIYVAHDPILEGEEADEIQKSFFGGLPIELGYCNGTNKLLNAVEYHRCSELGVAATDLILLVGRQQDIVDNTYDTSKIEAFFVPAGTVYEMYATTLHYAPCSVDGKPFKNVVILPKGTNDELSFEVKKANEDPCLFAVNKWLIAHADAKIDGAVNGLKGVNVSV